MLSSGPSVPAISIVGVTESGKMSEEHSELFMKLQGICSEKGYDLRMRAFECWKYSADRNEITSLPAFHVYVANLYRLTIFPEDHLFERLESFVKEHEERKAKKKESWIKNIVSYSSFFTGRFATGARAASSNPITEAVSGDNPMHA